MQRISAEWLLNGARGGAQEGKRKTDVSKSSVLDVRPPSKARLVRLIEQVRVIAQLYRCREVSRTNQWIQSYACETKTSRETQKSVMKFLERRRKPEVIYTDNSLEFGKSCEDLSRNHCTSTPHRSETNGTAERAVRRVKEGTSAVLLQSGLNESWWADSMDVTPICETLQICYLMGRRPMKDVLGNHLKDLLFHLVHWLRITLSLRRTSQESINLERKSYLQLFVGYALYAERTWKGDVLVADLEELETMDASEIYSKKTQCERGDISQRKKENLFFQSQMDELRTLGGDQDLKTSTLVRHRPIQGESNIDFLGESIRSVSSTTS